MREKRKISRWHRRTYVLDGKEISSREVNGIVHKARVELPPCMDCGKPVLPGQKYVMILVLYADPVHTSCYHYGSDCILVVRTESCHKWGFKTTRMICKRVPTEDDLED